VSEDRLLELLRGLTILLIVAAVLLRLSGVSRPWARRARWVAVAAFSAAMTYAAGVSLLWALGRSF
jgi:hypothetical protein